MAEKKAKLVQAVNRPTVVFDGERVKLEFEAGDIAANVKVAVGKDGRETGSKTRTFVATTSMADVTEGKGAVTEIPNEGVRYLQEVKVILKDISKAAVDAKRDSKYWRNFSSNLNKMLGLYKGTKDKPFVLNVKDALVTKVIDAVGGGKQTVVEFSPRVLLSELHAWVEGKRQVLGADYAALPDETRVKVNKSIETISNKASKALGTDSKEIAFAIATFDLENGDIEAFKALQVKAKEIYAEIEKQEVKDAERKAGEVKDEEEELTEQADD